MAAHTLKGSVGNFDAQRAWQAALKLETAGRAAEWKEAGPALRTLERELALVREALGALADRRARGRP
jgi:HPt (histidine-containing phosphotransfer) domain-containing protein